VVPVILTAEQRQNTLRKRISSIEVTLSCKTHPRESDSKEIGWFAEPDDICNHESPTSCPAAGSVRYDDALLTLSAAQLALKAV
jgi:hypothetical protein